MSIEDTIRHNRTELAGTIHEFLDQLEVATAGLVRDADQTIAKIRQLVDRLADKVVVPNLGDMAARLDQFALEELLKFNDHKAARSILETAEAFARRQYQIDSAAELAEWKKNPFPQYSVFEGTDARMRREQQRREAADRPR